MGEGTKIPWATNTYNPWRGCSKKSPGCANCYAENDRSVRMHGIEWGPGRPRVRKAASTRSEPERWNRKAARAPTTRGEKGFDWCERCDMTGWVATDGVAGECPECKGAAYFPRRPRVFCGSLCDWLDEEVPTEWLADLLALIDRTPHLDWLLLTKRPEFWAKSMEEVLGEAAAAGDDSDGACLAADWISGDAPANVWFGVTGEDQKHLDERTELALRIPAAIRFLSLEPLLERVSLEHWLFRNDAVDGSKIPSERIGWAIVGAESGPRRRPFEVDWARDLRDQCVGADVPFFFKQTIGPGGKKIETPLLDGRTWVEFPDAGVRSA